MDTISKDASGADIPSSIGWILLGVLVKKIFVLMFLLGFALFSIVSAIKAWRSPTGWQVFLFLSIFSFFGYLLFKERK